MIYLELFWGFLQVGLFSFGGAYGAIPLIRDVVLSRGWLSDEALTYMIAVSESTPGPIMVNLATYVGSTQAGLLGAIVSTLAVITPAFVIILLITAALKRVIKNRYFQAALGGLKPCVIGLILATGAYMTLTNCVQSLSKPTLGVQPILMTVVSALILFGSKPILKKKISPILFIAVSAVLGVAVFAI